MILVETGSRVAGRAALSKLGPYPQPVVAGGVVAVGGQRDSIVTGVYFAKWLGASREVILSLASKSVTNPIAIEITASIGGIPAITAATVIIAGLLDRWPDIKC